MLARGSRQSLVSRHAYLPGNVGSAVNRRQHFITLEISWR
jgi:hypothetical protein